MSFGLQIAKVSGFRGQVSGSNLLPLELCAFAALRALSQGSW